MVEMFPNNAYKLIQSFLIININKYIYIVITKNFFKKTSFLIYSKFLCISKWYCCYGSHI